MCRSQLAESMRKSVLTTKITKATKNSENLYFDLRAPFDVTQGMLRVLRGGNYPLFLGCGYTTLGLCGKIWLAVVETS